MLKDRFGLGLSTASQAARDAYVEGGDLFLAGNAGTEAAFARAIAADDGFALAHAALARTLQLYSKPDAARLSAARARELAAGLGRQERGNVEMLATLVDGKGPAALPFAREHLKDYPRDVMVLAPCTGVFGLIGFSGRPGREAEQAAELDALAAAYGDEWWFLTSHAFALCEVGRLAEARRAIGRALELHPRSAHGAHVHAHVLYESDQDAAGLAWLEQWMPGLPREAQLHCHLSWHVALWNFQLGNIDAARRVYAADVRPGGAWGPPINVVTDSASLLWRMQLGGQPGDAVEWRAVRDYALREFPKAGITFVDVHTALACAAAGDAGALQSLVAQLNERNAAGKLAAGPLVPALAEAFGAYVRGDWAGVVDRIAPVLGEHERIGGSRAQRDLVEYTLLSACAKAGRPPATLPAGRLRRPPPFA
jgi:tetratricopeptide (TPR) repeat protein